MSNSDSHPQNTIKEYNFPSLDLIFLLTKERVNAQFQQVNALDSKANFMLGSSTALISAALVLQSVLLPQTNNYLPAKLIPTYCPTNTLLQILPLLILLALYLTTIVTTFLAYKIRWYKQAPEPSELYRNYLHREESSTKAEVFRAMVEAYKENDKVIRSKVLWIKISFILLSFEATTLTIYILFRSVC